MTTQATPTKHQCPECPAHYADARGLAIHRRYKHGIAGTSPAAVSARSKRHGSTTVHKRLSGRFPCTECKFVAKWQGGLTKHMRSIHGTKRSLSIEKQTLPPIVSNGAGANHSDNQEGHFATDGIPQATLALALGRFQELSKSIAFEHDLPAKSFTARLAELIYATSLR